MSPVPTTAKPATVAQPQNKSAAPAVLIPFTRASRQKSRLVGNYGPTTLGTSQQMQAPLALPAAGFLRFLRLTVTATTAGNTAAVAFQNDAPFNVLQQISVLSANGDALISPIDGFSLYLLNKYAAIGTDKFDPVADPGFSKVTGAAGNGGSFSFNIRIPFEVDTRDAFGALQNMAANQSFLLQYGLATTGQLYSVAPTNAPVITMTAVMEYWSAPGAVNATGDPQSQQPLGTGSVSLVQTQQPPITPNTQQNIQMLNVGNTIRSQIFVLRDSAGNRTDAAWPNVTNFYVNNDPLFYKTKANWNSQMALEYGLSGPSAVTPTAGALDAGVYVLSDFLHDGSQGNGKVSAGGNRDLWLVTGSATALNIEAVNWGSAASSLLVLQNTIRPASAQAVYAPKFI